MGKVSVTIIRFDKIGKADSSPSEKLPAEATTRYTIACRVCGMFKVQETSVLLPLETEMFYVAFVLLTSASTGCIVKASNNINLACPLSSLSERLVILEEKVIWSPSRINRGGLGTTINSFCVLTMVSKYPVRKSGVCAIAINFQEVRLSGVVNWIFTFPFSSVCKFG